MRPARRPPPALMKAPGFRHLPFAVEDIEGMVGRALRASILAGADHITKNALATVVAEFMPSTQGLERELQETAAILECTDRQFLPPAILQKLEAAGGRGALQERLTALKQMVRSL